MRARHSRPARTPSRWTNPPPRAYASPAMRILFLGDVMGRAGRAAVDSGLPRLRADLRLDFVVVNGENATSGAGLSPEHAKALLAAGADVVTLGDHAFDQKDMLSFIESEPRIIRPLNYAKVAPGRGARVYDAPGGRKVLVAQVLGQVFMKRPFDDPFSALDACLRAHPMGGMVQASLIDIHAEATSEKMALGHFSDGRASIVVGTHTHVPTADAMVLAGGTAYLTDAGMCGDYDSIIGMDKVEPMRRFITGMPKDRFTPAEGEATLCGLYVDTDDRTGRSLRAVPIRHGGRLSGSRP
jgi:metallophosphoesterase (TIGR00282 family)